MSRIDELISEYTRDEGGKIHFSKRYLRDSG
jgi:hypothetical protein